MASIVVEAIHRRSASHADGLTLAVAGSAVELRHRGGCFAAPQHFGVIFGEERFGLVEQLIQSHDMSLDTASTCMWAVVECLKKSWYIGKQFQSLLASSNPRSLHRGEHPNRAS